MIIRTKNETINTDQVDSTKKLKAIEFLMSEFDKAELDRRKLSIIHTAFSLLVEVTKDYSQSYSKCLDKIIYLEEKYQEGGL